MSASGVFGPAPDSIDLSQTQNNSIASAVISLMVIGTIFVILRIIARTIRKGISLAIDDYCILLGLVSLLLGSFDVTTANDHIAFCTWNSDLHSCLPYGGGQHLWGLTASQFTTIWKILFAYVIIYACAVTFTKLSIVLFYRRMFGMTWGLWGCVFLVISYWITVCTTIIVSCHPLDYFWTRYTTKGLDGHCINVPLFFFANGIWAMLVDVCILVIPIPIVMKLRIPRSQKFFVLLIFLLGSFVCIASIVRIITIHKVITSADLTWSMGQLFIWSSCEPFIGIVCACVPTLAPIFRHWWSTVRTRESEPSSTPPTAETNPQGSYRSSKRHLTRQTNITDNSNASTVQVDFRIPKSKKDWNRLEEGSQVDLRDDDEMELTIDIAGSAGRMRTKESDEELGIMPMADIVAKRYAT